VCSPLQMLPVNDASMATLRPSRLMSFQVPSSMCQTRTPSQSP
jgi:hypothetical protein